MGASGLVGGLDQHNQPVGTEDPGEAGKAVTWHMVHQVAFILIPGTQHMLAPVSKDSSGRSLRVHWVPEGPCLLHSLTHLILMKLHSLATILTPNFIN